MAEEQLNLRKFAPGRATQLGACAPQIMRRDARNANLGCIPPERLPDDLFAEALAGDGASAIHRAENMTGGDSRRRSPRVNRHFHQVWHRRRSDAPMLSDEIDDAPAPVALLDARRRERRHFRASQPAPEKNRKDGTVA